MKKGLSFLCAFALIVSAAVAPASDSSTGYTSPTTREHMMGS